MPRKKLFFKIRRHASLRNLISERSMSSDFEKYFFSGHFWFFLRRVKRKKTVYGHFLPLMTVVGKNKSHPCARNCALTNFIFLKIEKNWKKYFWNTLLSAPQDPILRPPMTSQDPETININQKYILYKRYIVFSSFNKKTGQILNLTYWGATLGPPGGLQEAPHAFFL